jgi:Tol biopolymer transport system component
MEYVDGAPICDYCDSHLLGIRARLELFADVCAALEHAHGRGLVHRDVKPSNVLVGELDGRPFPKVIDFGIARAISLGDVDGTRLTRAGQIVGTPEFMSPEQFAGGPVDARSDAYSLGLVLYELLAGTLPFDATGAGRETEAVTASRRLTALGPRVAEVARLRGEDAASLRGRLRGDLDAILGHALEREPERRYHSAGEFAADLRRFLRNEPVIARGGFGYRVWKRVRRRKRALAVGVIAAACLGGLAWAAWVVETAQKKVAALSRIPRVVPLATAEGDEVSPSFSPDGERVVYVWNGPRQDNFDLYLLDGPGREPARLTTDPRPDFAPAWSPDGKWIAFLRGMPDGKAAVMLRDVSGSAEQLLMTGLHITNPREMALDWSPDSRWLATDGEVGDGLLPGILLLSTKTSERRRLTTQEPKEWDHQAVFSADGHALAFAHDDGLRHSQIRLLRLTPAMRAEGPARQVAAAGLEQILVQFPRFAPGGKDLLAVAGTRFWRIPLDGIGAPGPIDLGGNPITPAVSTARRRLAFARQVQDPNIWKMDLFQGGANPLADPSHAAPILSSATFEQSPAVSADGKQVAFASGRSGKMLIWTSDLEGGHARAVSTRQGGSPQWSPDGTQIAFDSRAQGETEICVVPDAGGPERCVTNGSGPNVLPVWSRDGQWIYFNSARSHIDQIWRAPASGGKAEQVTSQGGIFALPSPDGQWIYYTKSRTDVTSLWRIPVAGGAEERVLDGIPFSRGFAFGKTGIYFLQSSLDTRARTLRFFETATGRISDVHRFTRRVMDFTLLPNEGGILYTQVDHDGLDLWLAENFQ